MKVLILTNFIYDIEQPVFKKNACGFGIMVNDIVNAVSENDDVYLLTRAFHSKLIVNKYTLVSHTKGDFLRSLTIPNIKNALIGFFTCKESIRMKLRYAYYNLDMGSVKNVIKQIKPDVVHVHGLSYSTKQYINLLRKMEIPFVVTLHGLIGLDDSVNASEHDKLYEKEFLVLSEKEKIPVTVISSGMKYRIQEYYHISGSNIFVVLNGIDINTPKYSNRELDVFRDKLGIKKTDKVIVFIGNITKNKNQLQLIEAINLMSSSDKKNIKVYFAGKDVMDGVLQKKTQDYGLTNIITFLGFISKNEINKLYDIADLNIFTSLNDGFGLPIVEGYLHGIPVITYSDLDSFTDIYHKDSVIIPLDRSPIELAKSIKTALVTDWDKKKISLIGEKYSIKNMGMSYTSIYRLIKKRMDKC